MTTNTDWQRDDTVVIYRVPGEAPYSDEAYEAASVTMLDALDVQITQKKVTLKPNVVYGVAPDSGLTVHPAFLRGVVRHMREMAEHYAAVEYDKLAAETGINLVDLNADDFVRVDIPDGVVFKQMPIGRTVWDPDAFFLNIPKMRTHNLAVTTIAIKALQG